MTDPLPFSSFWFGQPVSGARRVTYNQARVLEMLLFGRSTLFRPRLASGPRTGAEGVSALYDLGPLRQRLGGPVDFDILNSGAARLSMATTDVVGGERIASDTADKPARLRSLKGRHLARPTISSRSRGGGEGLGRRLARVCSDHYTVAFLQTLI